MRSRTPPAPEAATAVAVAGDGATEDADLGAVIGTSGQRAASSADADAAPPSAPWPRLGRVEALIVRELQVRGGHAPRASLLTRAFPELGPRPAAGGGTRDAAKLERWLVNRADAESAISRAITSLSRKGLVITERRGHAGRTLLRAPEATLVPEWERSARDEETLARQCGAAACDLERLARRARTRAVEVRRDETNRHAAAHRRADLEFLRCLAGQLALAG